MMKFRTSAFRTLACCAGLMLPLGCTTTEGAKQDDPAATDPATPPPGDAPPADAPPPAENPPAEAPPSETPAETPPAAAEAAAKEDEGKIDEAAPKAAAGPKDDPNAIDDETPIPAGGPGAEKFRAAVDVAQNDPASAVRKFEEAANAVPNFYAAWFNAGAAAERAGDLATAERHYRKALEVRADYGPALTNLYLLLKKKGDTSGANAVVDKALSSHPRRAGPHLAAAMRAYSERNFNKTKEEALAAIRIDERTVAAMRLMGAVFREEKRFETAKFALENALVLEPGNALLHLDLGHVKLALEDEKGARESFEKAVKLRPNLAEAQEQYGILMERYGDADVAVEAYRKAVALRPNSAEAQLHLGNGLRSQKKYAEAEAAYKKALEIDPSLHITHFNLGLLYMDNEIAGRDALEQMEAALASLTTFAESGAASTAAKSRVDDYQKTLERRIKREKKRRKRDAERKAIEEEEKAKAAAEAKPAEGGEGAAAETPAGDAPAGDAPPAADGDASAGAAAGDASGDGDKVE